LDYYIIKGIRRRIPREIERGQRLSYYLNYKRYMYKAVQIFSNIHKPGKPRKPGKPVKRVARYLAKLFLNIFYDSK
jgi:hypothetical protein